MSLLPIDPADFPDVPTRKALIAIDLQNDFLADDGALPVKQPDGMTDRIIQLAQAVRASGYGEIIWVRSQFDTSRPATDDQIMAAETPQLPSRPGASAASRNRRSHPTVESLEADPEAFLSIVEPGAQPQSQPQARSPTKARRPKPQCVRKGTRGAEFLPAIVAAKGPRDYAMTKSYYSAFQTGQLLNLLRRQFATELFICGSLSNVSVYATALAASSHGFDITIVEDCCGYRSEMRHMNAARRLMDQTGCEFRNAADVIPTLRPKSPSPGAAARGPQTPRREPPQIPAGLIAAAMAGSKGIPVRPKPASSPASNPAQSTEGEKGSKVTVEADAAPATEAGAGKADPVSPSPPSTSRAEVSMVSDGLKLSAHSPDNAVVSEPADAAPPVNEVTTVEPENEPSQPQPQPQPEPEAGEKIQPVVSDDAEAAGSSNAPTVQPEREARSAAPNETKKQDGPAAVLEALSGGPVSEGQNSPSAPARARASSRSGAAIKESNESVMAEPSPTPAIDFVVSEKLLMTSTPAHILLEMRDRKAKKKNPSPPPPAQPDSSEPKVLSKDDNNIQLKNSVQETDQQATGEDPVVGEETEEAAEADTTKMAGDNKARSIVSEPLCEGDTTLTTNFLPPSLVEGLFEKLCEEVHFKKMRHQGGEVPRFVAVQGSVEEDGTQPVYRHPSDESPPLEPFTPAVQKIRELTERALGHPLNHALIQCYRDGNDYISEHSDKTLDIFRWSYIANVSIGAQRTMVFRTKRAEKKTATMTGPEEVALTESEDAASARLEQPAGAVTSTAATIPSKRQTVRCPMPHNSLLKMGLMTNEKWLHGIKADKRPQHEKSQAELAWNGIRISLTFRYIDTFLSPQSPITPTASPTATPPITPTSPAFADSDTENDTNDISDEPLIWGQGAISKTRHGARPVVNGQTSEAVTLIRAFGRENNSPDFDWEANYGRGYDVLHMRAAPRYFGCGNALIDGRVRLMLVERGIKHARSDIGWADGGGSGAAEEEVDRAYGKRGSHLPLLVRGAAVGEVVPVRFEVDDEERTTVVGDVAILLYIDAKYPRARHGTAARGGGDAELARTYGRLYAALALEQRWKRSWEGAAYDRPFHKRRVVIKQFKPALEEFEAYAAETIDPDADDHDSSSSSSYHAATIAGSSSGHPSVADCALWPVLHDIARAWQGVADEGAGGWTVFGYLGLRALDAYYVRFARRPSVVRVFGEGVVEATTPCPPDLPTEEFGLPPSPPAVAAAADWRSKLLDSEPRMVEMLARRDAKGGGKAEVKEEDTHGEAEYGDDEEERASLMCEKGKLPLLSEFGTG